MTRVVLGSRKSPLAVAQARLVQHLLQKRHPALAVELETIRTTGDRMAEEDLAPLAESSKGLFVKEIETALLEGRIDLAIHSLKDMPTDLPAGLVLAGVPAREDPRDVLVASSPGVSRLDDLPPGALVGTGSPRRRIQIERLRPDLEVVGIRGNLGTRLRKLEEGQVSALVLAAAGLRRMGWEKRTTCAFSPGEMVPAAGQGALALEARAADGPGRELARSIEHDATRRCVMAERGFLAELGGGCQLPLAAHASLGQGEARFWAFVGDPGSGEVIRREARGRFEELEDLVASTTGYLLEQGARELLQGARLRPSP